MHTTQHYSGNCECSFMFFSMKLQQTVFLDVKAVGDSFSFVRRGGDNVASLWRFRYHGVGKIQDAANNGLIQPLCDAI